MTITSLAIGRNKLAAALSGGAIQALNLSLPQANGRLQGRRPIIEYGQVQKLVADIALATFGSQSLVHRLAGETDARAAIAEADAGNRGKIDAAEAMLGTHRELMAKALVGGEMRELSSAAKLWASETFVKVAYMAGQVFGGYGFINEYPITRLQRDARVTTLYEGTSEIQRNIIADWLLRNGELAREAAALTKGQVLRDLSSRLDHVDKVIGDEHPLRDTVNLAEQAKSLADWAFATILAQDAIRKMVTDKKDANYNGRGQFVTSRLANLMTSALVIDSAVQRALRVHQEGTPGIEGKLAQAFAYEELGRMREEALGLINNVYEGQGRVTYQAAMDVIDAMTKRALLSVDRLKQEIAKHFTEQGSYTL